MNLKCIAWAGSWQESSNGEVLKFLILNFNQIFYPKHQTDFMSKIPCKNDTLPWEIYYFRAQTQNRILQMLPHEQPRIEVRSQMTYWWEPSNQWVKGGEQWHYHTSHHCELECLSQFLQNYSHKHGSITQLYSLLNSDTVEFPVHRDSSTQPSVRNKTLLKSLSHMQSL